MPSSPRLALPPLALALLACGPRRHRRPVPPPLAAPPTPPPPPTRPADELARLSWLPPTPRSVARLRPGSIYILEYFGKDLGGRKAECWRTIEAGIDAGYMLEIAAKPP